MYFYVTRNEQKSEKTYYIKDTINKKKRKKEK